MDDEVIMFNYSKRLQYPISIKRKDMRMAKYIISQYGGPDGEMGAATRYLSQRFIMPDERGKTLLTDIGTEELGHEEMICTIVYQLTSGASIEEIEKAGLGHYYVDHGLGLYPQDTNGVPFSAATLQSTGDFITDLTEDLAAEEKARTTYEHLIDLANDDDVIYPLLFLRQREVVHYNRFKELLESYKKEYNKNY